LGCMTGRLVRVEGHSGRGLIYGKIHAFRSKSSSVGVMVRVLSVRRMNE